MNDIRGIEDSLLRFLQDSAAVPQDASRETDLIANGFLDSLVLVDLVLHIQREFGVDLKPADLNPSNFRSVAKIAELVDQRSETNQAEAA